MVALCASTATSLQGALWESPNWAAVGTLAGKAGYDSNLTLSQSGDGDYFVQASPSAVFFRRNSISDLRLTGKYTVTEFLQGRESTLNDIRLQGSYAYPIVQNEVPLYKADATWAKATEANQYLGRRVEYTKASLSSDGYLRMTGKAGLRGSADFETVRYENSLNHNTRAHAFAGIAYKYTPLTEASLNVGLGVGRSTPSRIGQVVESRETYVTVRVRGQITPKITGSVHGGFGEVSYRGGYENRYTLPVAGVDLTWGIDPRRTLVIAGYSGADYTADGQSVNTARAFISFTNAIVNHWEFTVRGGPSYSTFQREFRQRTDNAWEAGAEFAYRPSDRFRVSASLTQTDQRSTISFNEYDRTVVSLGSSYRF